MEIEQVNLESSFINYIGKFKKLHWTGWILLFYYVYCVGLIIYYQVIYYDIHKKMESICSGIDFEDEDEEDEYEKDY